MGIINTLFNNTLLIPALDGLLSANPMLKPEIVDDLHRYNESADEHPPIKGNLFWVEISQNGGPSSLVGECEKVSTLEIFRNVESKAVGGNNEYMVKLPGPMQYNEVSFTNLLTKNERFLQWISNGVSYGGLERADIDIYVGTKEDHVVFTLRDAFPVFWSLGSMTINLNKLVENGSAISYTLQDGSIPVSTLKVAYSKLEFRTERQ